MLTSTSTPTPAPPRQPEPAAPRVTQPAPARGPLHGREDVLERVLETCRTGAPAPIVALRGPAGSGRSALLARLRERLAEQGVHTAELRITRDEQDVAHLATRLADELGGPRLGRGPLLRLLAQAAEQHGPLVVLVDDAQRIAPHCLADLARLASPQQRGRITFVCAFRTPAPELSTVAEQLRGTGSLHEEILRPLGESAVRGILADRLQAPPEPRLVRQVRTAARGLPAFVHALADGLVEADAIRLVDRRACAVGGRAPRLRITHPLFAGLRELGCPQWPVLKALAVLHPVRGALPALLAAATGLAEADVLAALDSARAGGILTGTRFRVPALAALLSSCLGPYERRRISALAIEALWSGQVRADAGYLAERLATAGRLVDTDRAAVELAEHAARAEHGDRADRWGRAAARMSADPAQRAALLHRHAVTSALHRRYDSAAETAEIALRTGADQLDADAVQELEVVQVIAAAATGADVAPRGVARAVGLCLQNRWAQAHDELTAQAAQWRSGGRAAAAIGRTAQSCAAAVLGRPRGPERVIPAGGTGADVLRLVTRVLTLSGEFGEQVPAPAATADRALRAAHAGRWDEALDLGRSALADASARGRPPEHTALLRELAGILVARGRLHRARGLLDTARAQPLLLPHLLAVPEAEHAYATGSPDAAHAVLSEALESATAVAGTDELLLGLAKAEVRRGDLDAAVRHVARLEQVADALGTAAARRNRLLGLVLVRRDARAAAEAVALAEQRGRPFELATTLAAVARAGLGGAKHLRTAYELFGDLDALLPRARLRLLMRDRKISVPGRGTTVAENERLMATLIAEGLSNAQLASILGTSEKGVEGRLTRLFQRAGYRSRAELATAVLNEEFPG